MNSAQSPWHLPHLPAKLVPILFLAGVALLGGPAWARAETDHPRRLEKQTPILKAKRVLVAAPRSSHGQRAAQAFHRALVGLGGRAELLSDPASDVLKASDGPVIVIGNLADSRCVRELYFRFLCATDLWYPGPGGYELRTLCDPFRTGQNVILVGYSDEQGAKAATEALLVRLKDPIPHLAVLKPTRLPWSDEAVRRTRATPLPKPDYVLVNKADGDAKGWLYYLTGDPKVGEEYRAAWKAYVACGYARTATVPQPHLFSLNRVVPWRLVEDMGLFSDDERLAITRFVYGWAQSPEGWAHVLNSPRVRSPYMPRQNHELIPALALAYTADYFKTHFPGVAGPEKWAEAARRAFEPYGPSWKPLCDGLCHGWYVSQPPMLEYALLEPDHSYFKQGGALKAARCAMAIVNNEGWLPSAGDADTLAIRFPGPSLRIAATWYNDGRYQFVADLAPPERRYVFLEGTAPFRAYAGGVEPKRPDDLLGVTVIPVDPLVYDVWRRDRGQASGAVTTPPSAPIEQCFDKLAIRTGWKRADDYLLIDGLGGGSHSYDDAAGVLDYSRLGLSLIVSEDVLVFTAPEKHSLVTIVRDGECDVVPGFAILEAHETDGQGNAYVRIRQKDYCGADWVREVHLRPKSCVVFVDTVLANQAGDFAIEAHFRTPARFVLNGREARCKRNSPCAGLVDFRIESSCEPSQLSVTEDLIDLIVHSAFQDQTALWKEQYHTDEVVLTSLDARFAGRLEAGELVRLAHVAQVCGPQEAPVHLSVTDRGVRISDGRSQHELKTFKPGRSKQTQPATGGSSSGPSLVNAPTLSKVFEADSRVTAIRPLRNGSVAVGTERGRVTFLDPQAHRTGSKDLAGPIRDIGAAEDPSNDRAILLVGHGPNMLTAFDPQGRILWESEIEREPCPWPWWELVTPAPVQVAGAWDDKGPLFAVGCGDIQVRCLGGDGKERWRWRYNEGVPGRIRVAQVDGSGKPRIVVGGDILTDVSACRILDSDGRLLADHWIEGWTSRMTALAFGAAGQRHFIGCGANRGNNLHLFESAGPDDGKAAPAWNRLWARRLGGYVAGIEIFAPADRVIVGTSQGFLQGYDLKGNLVWSRLFAQGIRHLASLGAETIVCDESGRLTLVSLSGNVRPLSENIGPTSIVLDVEGRVYLVSARTVWQMRR